MPGHNLCPHCHVSDPGYFPPRNTEPSQDQRTLPELEGSRLPPLFLPAIRETTIIMIFYDFSLNHHFYAVKMLLISVIHSLKIEITGD